jgi:hypothetical protein
MGLQTTTAASAHSSVLVEEPPHSSEQLLRELCELSAVAGAEAESLLGGGEVARGGCEGWVLHSAEAEGPWKGVRVEKLRGYKRRRSTVLRLTTRMPATVQPHLVRPLNINLGLRRKWDANIGEVAMLQDFGADALCERRQIVVNVTVPALGGMISPREFVTQIVSTGTTAAGSHFDVSRACEHKARPAATDRAATRGETQYYSLSFTPLSRADSTWQGQGQGGWLCEYIVQVELNLPSYLPRGPIERATIDAAVRARLLLSLLLWSRVGVCVCVVSFLRLQATFWPSPIEPHP